MQDTILFSGSVRDNIAYGTDADLATIEEVARAAGALPFIQGLPDGFETLLGPGGVGLSGGQRQRIGIARVLLRDPPVLVLDEPTTGLDPASEALVMAGLNRLIEGRTTILITHSTALARSADHVAVHAAGRVVEYGVPERLLSSNSAFRRLTDTQERLDDTDSDPPGFFGAWCPTTGRRIAHDERIGKAGGRHRGCRIHRLRLSAWSRTGGG